MLALQRHDGSFALHLAFPVYVCAAAKSQKQVFLLCIYGDYKSIMCVSIYYYNSESRTQKNSLREKTTEAAEKGRRTCH